MNLDYLENKQLQTIKGGATAVSSAILNALMRTISTMFTLGQAVGTAIRRAYGKNYC